MKPSDIQDVVRGDAITASRFNQGNVILRSVATITGHNGVGVVQTEAGTTISSEHVVPFLASFLVQITNAGPKGEADFTDPRYWGKISSPAQGKENDALTINADTIPTAANGDPVRPGTICCTNLSEFSANTHTLATDGSIYGYVFAVYDQGNPNNPHYVFVPGGGALPPGGSKYQVLMRIDSLGTAGWMWPVFH